MEPSKKRRSGTPARTAEQREYQLINLAYDEAERRIIEGRASAQVLTHFLRLGTVKAELEKEKLKQENLLLEAKTKALQSMEHMEELYKEAIIAIRGYQGHVEEDVELLDD